MMLPVDFDAYRHYSRLFIWRWRRLRRASRIAASTTIYIDLTEVDGETRELAQRIAGRRCDATGLTCSIGVTPKQAPVENRSDGKPDGSPHCWRWPTWRNRRGRCR